MLFRQENDIEITHSSIVCLHTISNFRRGREMHGADRPRVTNILQIERARYTGDFSRDFSFSKTNKGRVMRTEKEENDKEKQNHQ